MREIPLTQGYTALVSDRDYARVVAAGPWTAQIKPRKDGSVYTVYAIHSFGRHSNVRLHRFILGVTDPKIEVDHKDGNGLQCNRRNLRTATHGQNVHNQRLSKANTSGYKGVSWDTQSRKWTAYIYLGGKQIWLGFFTDKVKAARAYDKAAHKYFGRFAHTNF
jgi:hypothetical protein